MNITPQMYGRMSDKASPKSNSKVNIPMAFLIGGIICVIGQLISTLYGSMGLDKTDAAAWTSITLVAASAFCTGMGWYQQLARHAGAGTLVPITGFANSIVAPAIEFKSEGFVLGLGAKMFVIAGPVLVYGITASVVFGVLYFFIAV